MSNNYVSSKRRTAVSLLAVALIAIGGRNTVAEAQTQRMTQTTRSANQLVSELFGTASGVVLTSDNYHQYVTTGNPGTIGTSMAGADGSKIFVLYNKGTGKFLNVGGYWGTSAVLSDIPCPLWLQIRNEDKTKTRQTTYLRYPETASESTELPLSEEETKWVGKYKAFLAYANGHESQFYVGSEEGKTRTRAVYKSVQVVTSDGTVKDALKFESTSDPVSTGNGSASATATYSGDGATRFISSTPLSTLSLASGDAMVATLDLSSCTDSIENVFSVGTQIGSWTAAGVYNMHIYYTQKTKTLLLRGCFDESVGKDPTEESIEIAESSSVVLKLTKDGFYVNGHKMPPYHQCKVGYDATRAGQIIRFKTDNGDYVTDADCNLQIDDNGQPFAVTSDSYIYSDSPSDTHPTLFISRRVNKDAASKEVTGHFLGYVPSVFKPASIAPEKASGVYTDRVITLNDKVYKPELNRWIIVPTGTAGEYKLALNMTVNVETGSTTDGAKTDTYYLTASDGFVTGATAYKGNENQKQHFLYSTVDKSGNRTYVDNLGDDYTMVKMTATPDNDDNATWKLISANDYTDILKTQKSVLLETVDMSAVLADPDFARNDKALEQWTVESTLQSTSNKYHETPLRIGYDGYYKVAFTDEAYVTGASSDYNFADGANRGANDFRANHSRAMCASVQNGGYGKMYQTVNLTRAGWYIVRCQGMSTVGAKLFATVTESGETAQHFSTPLYELKDEVYKSDLQIMSDAKAYWPYEPRMPMYNATIAMTDKHAHPNLVSESATQVLFYVNSATEATPATLTLGVDVPQTTSTTRYNEGHAYSSDFTAFDNFRLLYGGVEAHEPYLVLDEDDETLDHLDNTVHRYKSGDGVNKHLYLHRTFTQNVWNTIILPVGLTETQFKTAFGDDAELAELASLSDRYIRFHTVQTATAYVNGGVADATLYWLKPMTPYLIKIKDATKVKGDKTDLYTAYLFNCADNGKTYVEKAIGGSSDHSYYDIPEITMEEGIAPTVTDGNFTHWNFRGMKGDGTNSYVVKGQQTEAFGDGVMTAYGMLTRNYTVSDGKNTPLAERALMADAYAMTVDKSTGKPVMKYRKGGGASKAFRCWFQYTDATTSEGSAAKPQLAVLIDGVGETTGIDDIAAADAGITPTARYADGVYTLDGQKVATDAASVARLPKGVYVVNGRKVVR